MYDPVFEKIDTPLPFLVVPKFVSKFDLWARPYIRVHHFLLRYGGSVIVESRRTWQDQKVHQLYTIAMSSKNEIIRRQVLIFLGALERAGSEDAVWAIDDIKKNTI